MATFFTSDTHFGHEGIIRHCYRLFPSVAAMDEALIAAWNEYISPDDVVWHLGDFTLSGADAAEEYLSRLNGTIHLIWGNHDRNSVRRLTRWASSAYAREIKVDGVRITLCHYAMLVWNQCGRGALMLHGHSHGNLPGNSQSTDVGVDAWSFRPTTLQQIQARLASQPQYQAEDHHASAQ
jgi:calcineurin-like phosphoesterase family protein